MRLRTSKSGLIPSSFLTDRSKAVSLLQFFFVHASVVSYLTCLLALFVHQTSFLWCLGRAVLHDCGFSWVYSLIFQIRPQG